MRHLRGRLPKTTPIYTPRRVRARSPHCLLFLRNRVTRDLSLDSGYKRYHVEDDVQTAWHAVYETKTMVSNVNNTLEIIMRRLDYLEDKNVQIKVPNHEGDNCSEDPNPLAKGKDVDR